MKISTHFLVYRGEDEIELQIAGDYIPETPDCWECPGTNAEIDDLSATLNGVEFDLTDVEIEKAKDALFCAAPRCIFEEAYNSCGE